MIMSLDNPLKTRNANTKNGTIIIVDISGFTEFVYKTRLIEGKDILLRLLSCIIEKNKLGLCISEIEGDAVLFYHFGTPPSFKLLLDQFRVMNNYFMRHIKNINSTLDSPLDLSLKMIGHYGPLTQYQIAGFSKLFGRAVLESHLLLKNAVNSNSYVLLTNDFLNRASFNFNEPNFSYYENEQCEMLRGVKKLCYRFYDFSCQTGTAW